MDHGRIIRNFAAIHKNIAARPLSMNLKARRPGRRADDFTRTNLGRHSERLFSSPKLLSMYHFYYLYPLHNKVHRNREKYLHFGIFDTYFDNFYFTKKQQKDKVDQLSTGKQRCYPDLHQMPPASSPSRRKSMVAGRFTKQSTSKTPHRRRRARAARASATLRACASGRARRIKRRYGPKWCKSSFNNKPVSCRRTNHCLFVIFVF